MNEQALLTELQRVGSRYRRLRMASVLAIAWLLAIVCVIVIYKSPAPGLIALAALAVAMLTVLMKAMRATRDPLWIAHRLERKFPDLDARLLAALEQRPGAKTHQLGYLQETVIIEALQHARDRRWETVVPASRLRLAMLGQWATLACLLIVTSLIITKIARHPSAWQSHPIAAVDPYGVKVEPGDTNIERGSSLLVLARFSVGRMPGDVQLISRDLDGQVRELPMSKSLNDPVFAARVPSLSNDLSYAVRYGGEQTPWYKASVFDFPDLKQADAHLKYPAYTKLPEKDVQDIRSITAVEGSKATLTFHLNKSVKEAKLMPATRPADAVPVALSADPKDPSTYSISLDLKQSQRFHLQLLDADGRANKQPPELAINVNPNRPPELKPVWPGHDVDVSPLQEMTVRERVSDDFGVERAGLTYSMAGQPPQDVVLGENVPGKEQREVAHLVSLESLSAQPDQLLTYYFWAEDFGPDGKIRRTSGDMYFAEVRPFEEIFRQGQQPSESEQQQQNQQANANGQRAEELAEQQKQIIAATWKVMRRELDATPSPQFVPDVKLIGDSQSSLREQAAQMGEKLTDARSRAYLANVLKFMDTATTQLTQASATPAIAPLSPALSAEQAAYQELLKLRAREFDVVRGDRQQRGSQSASSASSRRQQQLDQLKLDQEQNRYETQRSAPQQQENPQQRETRQVLNRLRELAQRQDDLNRQVRELQSALERARDEEQRQEIQRQLAHLRDQQQQQLRDTDELRDRMDQPENQQRMADERQQLEQTRENVRRAAESLQKNQMPQAEAAGARASEQLNNLRDQFRRSAAGQFNEAMNQMRQDARELDQKQQELSQKMDQLENKQQQPTLRDGGERQQIAEQLGQQKQKLDQVTDTMRKTIDDAEANEPLLSKQLYDTLRKTSEQQTDQALDVSKQLLERGFTKESQQAGAEAAKGITKLREGVEQAATSVLGDEAESLRRARGELDQLSQELQNEIDRNRPPGQAGATPSTRPASDRQRVARGGATTRNSRELAGGGAATRAAEQLARAGRGQQQSNSQQGRDRQAGDQQQSSEASQPGQSQQQDGQQQQAGGGQPRGQSQQARGGQPGQQNHQDQGQSQQQQQSEGQPQEGSQQANAEQPGQASQGSQQARAQGQQQQGRGQRGGGGGGLRGTPQDANQDPQQQQDQPQQSDETAQANQPGGQRAGQQQASAANRNTDGANENANPTRGFGGTGGNANHGPLTGEDYRDWSDRLRDVEEMVSDPHLRAEAARIRERARDVRIEFKRHSVPPNWNTVDLQLGQPLAELRDAVNQELLRHQSKDALVPIDRDAVPPEYAEQVRRYYERLGSGR